MEKQEEFDAEDHMVELGHAAGHAVHELVEAGDEKEPDGDEHGGLKAIGGGAGELAGFGEVPGIKDAAEEGDGGTDVQEADEVSNGIDHFSYYSTMKGMIHEVLAVGALQCNCSILGDEVTREAIVVDPGDDITEILAIVAKHQLTVKMIVITHAHIDHIGGAAKLKAITHAPVIMNPKDQELYDAMSVQAGWLGMETPEQTTIDTPAKDGDTLRFGDYRVHVLHTPGHTEGSTSLYIPAEKTLIAGDTLFRDSIGRTDLPGGDGRKILSSIKTKLLVLPEDTEVICGHGPSTTIGREAKRNPHLRGLS